MGTPRLDRLMDLADERRTPPEERPHLLFAHARAVEEALEEALASARKERMRIDDLLEMAARDLPEGWSVRIEVERGAAWVKAIAPDGVEYDIDSDEAEIADLVRDAIEVATANAALRGGKAVPSNGVVGHSESGKGARP